MRWIAFIRARLRGEENGQGLAEYALILGLVALAAVTALTGLGSAIASSAGFAMFT